MESSREANKSQVRHRKYSELFLTVLKLLAWQLHSIYGLCKITTLMLEPTLITCRLFCKEVGQHLIKSFVDWVVGERLNERTVLPR